MAVDLSQVATVDTEPGELPPTMAAWVIREERFGEETAISLYHSGEDFLAAASSFSFTPASISLLISPPSSSIRPLR